MDQQMDHLVKVVVAEPDSMNSIPRTHKVEGENQLS